MLLETLDVLQNDVVIYSENNFDFKENFKIVFKRADVKRPQKIDYFEVCKFFRDPTPKNIIAYRLLTSNTDLDAYSTKFGYFIIVDDNLELIYFDPIFALKDLANLKINTNNPDFRFKIQQVGYTASGSKNNECVYSEVYSFDLRAIEAQNQNDKVFASAIFALDKDFVDENENLAVKQSFDNIAEDEASESDSKQISKASIIQNTSRANLNNDNISILKESFASNWESSFNAFNSFKQASVNPDRSENKKSSFSDFLNKEKQQKEEAIKGIFDDQSKIDFSGRDSVVLKFTE
jgi:hypothetical protein